MFNEIKWTPEQLKFKQEMEQKQQEGISRMPPATPEEAVAQYERLNGRKLQTPAK
jgi:hypothetical protein